MDDHRSCTGSLSSCKKKASQKKVRLERDSKPCPCDAGEAILPTELSGQLVCSVPVKDEYVYMKENMWQERRR